MEVEHSDHLGTDGHPGSNQPEFECFECVEATGLIGPRIVSVPRGLLS